ncbi:MAG TPA: hypothetical protein VN026_05525 [Bacteroidia bacterium]|jgi:hypothetical protein|nr:hypothetical protein [Bacteroidia bacterium]
MKQILLNIPDNKYNAFLEAIKNLDFIRVYNENDINVTEEEKKLIRDRIKNSKQEYGQNWDQIKDSFNLD